MYKIVRKAILSPDTTLLEIMAPHVARKAAPGQFIIYRLGEFGERIPLTIADSDAGAETITIIFQAVGKSTKMLAKLDKGDFVDDITGPLGRPSRLEGIGRAVVIGGGLGCAIAYPQAKALTSMGAKVDLIAGFRTKELVMMEDMMAAASENLYICTDDGSYGEAGFVTTVLERLLKSGGEYDECIAIGPVPMMRAVCNLTKEYGLKTTISMNPIMIDGTGMCGCCRVTVAGETKFACVDGPEFDGHEIDFDEAIARLAMYRDFEREKDEHYCRLEGMSDAKR